MFSSGLLHFKGPLAISIFSFDFRQDTSGETLALTMSTTPNSGSANPSNEGLLSLFECPVCFDYVLPPILQCHAGHLVCSNCRPQVTSCPTCRGQLGDNIRNLAMEKLASTVMFPCRYQSSGCRLSLLHTKKTDHEETCEFRPIACPFAAPGSSCKWQGSLKHAMSHLLQVHKSSPCSVVGQVDRPEVEGDFEFLAYDINSFDDDHWAVLSTSTCFGHRFMLLLKKEEKFVGHQQYFFIVQLIGTQKDAESLKIRVELNRQEVNGNRQRLTWEATPRSIHEGVSSAIMNSNCFIFDSTIAQLFDDNGNLV